MATLVLRETTNPYAITGLAVHDLYGYITHDVFPRDDQAHSRARLVIMYGDNGSGKTTLLKLAFHLLGAARRAGHRNALARIPFLSFAVQLADGTLVRADRAEPTIGAYHITLERKGLAPQRAVFDPNRLDDPTSRSKLDAILDAITGATSSFYFMSDDRDLTLDLLPDATDVSPYLAQEISLYLQRSDPKKRKEEYSRHGRTVLSLAESLDRLNYWLNSQANQRMRSGEASAHLIYTDVISRIISSQQQPSTQPPKSIRELVTHLGRLAAMADRFKEYGLATPLNANHLMALIDAAPQTQHSLIASILAPYLNGIDARFSKLLDLYEVIHTLVDDLRNYFYPKQVQYNAKTGLTISSPRGDVLTPAMLSSGERHLLLLITTAAVASTHRSILMIDEPEISLNLKWQRRLLNTLLRLSRATECQIILASHSVHLFGEQLDSVVKLSGSDHPLR